jgi:hypothetical protein
MEAKQFEQYEGRKRKEKPPYAIVHKNCENLRLNAKARNLYSGKLSHVKAFISKDGSMLALKPVSGGNVTADSLSAKGGNISFVGISSQLNAEFSSSHEERFEVSWNESKEMFVIDFSGKQV